MTVVACMVTENMAIMASDSFITPEDGIKVQVPVYTKLWKAVAYAEHESEFVYGYSGDVRIGNYLQFNTLAAKHSSDKLDEYVYDNIWSKLVNEFDWEIDYSVMFACPGEKIVLCEPSGVVIVDQEFWAIGSGAYCALGYLESSSGSVTAAAFAASKYNPYCGGEIKTVSVRR